jgi:ATP-dependent DNA ligase
LDQTFFAFDLPDHGGDFRQRLDALERLVKSANRPGLQICPTTREWADVAKYEWEGVVFKNLNSLYPKAMQDGKTTPHWVKYRAEWGVHADIPAV